MAWRSAHTSCETWWRALTLAGALATCGPTFAAHPLITEDTGTQGSGKFELENGFQRQHDGSDKSWEYAPQLSYGLADSVDLIARLAWIEQRSTDSRQRGLGDSVLDVKWRFHESGALTLGVRAGVDLPTGNADKGLGVGKASVHGLFIATLEAEPAFFHGNIGYTRGARDNERRDLWHAAIALLCTATPTLRLSAEAAADSEPDPTRTMWQKVLGLGAILTVREGFDVDVGLQRGIGSGSRGSTLLAGATLRW